MGKISFDNDALPSTLPTDVDWYLSEDVVVFKDAAEGVLVVVVVDVVVVT